MSATLAAPGLAARTRGLLWGALGVLAFSVSLPATRVAVNGGLSPAFVGFGRAAVAGVLALALLALWREPMPSRAVLLRLVSTALGIVFGFALFTGFALARVPSAHGVVVIGLLPAATAACAVPRGGERPGALFWAAAAAGVLCVLGFAWVEGGGDLRPADLLLLGAVATGAWGYAEGAMLSRTLGSVRVICLVLVVSLPLTLALSAQSFAFDAVTAPAWAGFCYLALVSMFSGFFAWFRGLALGGVARVGQLQLIQPLLSLLWAALFLGERVSPVMLAVAAGVIASVTVAQRSRVR